MNLIDRFRHLSEKLSHSDRGTGRTTLLAKAVKDLNGVLLCHDFKFAKVLEHEHGVVTKSTEVNLHGLMGPFFIDHHAVACLFDRAATELSAKEFTITKLTEEKRRSQATIASLEIENADYQRTNADLREMVINQANQISTLKLEKTKMQNAIDSIVNMLTGVSSNARGPE